MPVIITVEMLYCTHVFVKKGRVVEGGEHREGERKRGVDGKYIKEKGQVREGESDYTPYTCTTISLEHTQCQYIHRHTFSSPAQLSSASGGLWHCGD